METGEIRPEAVESYDKLMACPFTAHSTLELLDAALTAARADERERACKAVCANCHDDVPLLESNKALHRVGPMEYEQCYAAAIRAMEGR